MADVATLGLAVESSSVKGATADLKQLSEAADEAARKTAYYESVANRTGQSVDEVRRRFEAAASKAQTYGRNVDTLSNSFNRLKVSNDNATLSDARSAVALGRTLIAYNAIGLALQAVGLATSAYAALTGSTAPAIEKTLEAQARLINSIKTAYKEAGDQAGKFFAESKAELKLLNELNLGQLRSGIRSGIAEGLKGVTGVTSIEFNPLGDALGGVSQQQIIQKYEPFRREIEQLQSSSDDAEESLKRFRKAVSEAALASPQLKDLGGDLLSKFPRELADKATESVRANKILDGKGSKDDRTALGLSNGSDKRDPFDQQVISIGRHIAAIKADADAVGQTVGVHARLRTEAQLYEAAQRDGKTATDLQVAAIKRLGQEASDAALKLEKAKIDDQIKFDKDTLFLSPENVSIAQQLRGLYPDVATALGSAEAQAIRYNNTLKEVRDTALDFTKDLVRGLINGDSAMRSLANAASNLSSKLTDKALTSLFSGDFLSAGIQGIGAIVSGLVGNSAKKKADAEDARKAYQSQLENIDAFIAKANGTSNSLSDALASAAKEMDGFIQQAAKVGDYGKVAQLQAAGNANALRIVAEDAKKAQDEIASRSQSYQDRLFAAVNDNDSLQGQLAALDRKFAQERLEEQRRGGEALIDLEQAQSAERNQVVKRANDELRKQLLALATTIRDFLTGLQTGPSSILSPQAQLAAAQSNFNSTLSLAQGGNQDALGKITGVAQTLLDQAKSFFASSAGYTTIFNQVSSALSGLADFIAPPAAANDNSAAVIAAIQGTTTAVTTTSVSEQAYLNGIETFTNRMINSINAVGALISNVGNTHTYQNQAQIAFLSSIAGSTAGSASPTLWSFLGFQKGGMIPGLATGGMVGNGLFNVDSVLARYEGGGNIALAGGEGVINARATQSIGGAAVIDAINRSGRLPGNDNGFSAEVARALAKSSREDADRIVSKLDQVLAALETSPAKTKDALRQLVAETKKRAA